MNAVDSRAAERAVDELKRGRAIIVEGARRIAVMAVELASDEELTAFDGTGRADLIITDKRAAQLGLTNQRAAAGMRAVRLKRPAWIDAAGTLAVADPTLDLAVPLKGPFESVDVGDAEAALAALRAVKFAGLLPALHVTEALPGGDLLSVGAAEIEALRSAGSLRIVTRARLPLAEAPGTQVVAFRSPGGPEHLALIIGTPAREPLVRLHSACLTGDVLASLKCDCGDQLRGALAAMHEAGGGILLYLQQEGRGIGLMNKLRAYRLQDQGFDTVDANLRLGFEVDERDFAIAAHMLAALEAPRIRLLTNNPRKVAGLQNAGIEIAERVPLVIEAGPHNADYLAAKRDRSGHQL